uniref:Uncharacterized protein n=1 Tax=Rhizophora mucronata TaxID=61149 RepID=A0A2P2QJ15_RHIMU
MVKSLSKCRYKMEHCSHHLRICQSHNRKACSSISSILGSARRTNDVPLNK